MSTHTLKITGMTCDHCARTAQAALNALPGVRAEVSWVWGTWVKVVYSSNPRTGQSIHSRMSTWSGNVVPTSRPPVIAAR